MELRDISNLRLANQQISHNHLESAGELVNRMGAMQAQDFNMAKWAIGIRLQNTNLKLINKAIDNGEVLRTHVMRPTWHLVSPGDIRWMLQLTAPGIKSSLKSRHKQLEITDKVIKKSNDILCKALSGGIHLTREEIVALLEKNKFILDDNRASHLLMLAELDGIICSGKFRKHKSTYSLLEERVPKTANLSKDMALAELAGKYFTSHGPANENDFAWWSGLPLKDVRNALENIKNNFISLKLNSMTYWYKDTGIKSDQNNGSLYLLPAYDEFIISYKDRSAAISSQNNKKAISNNGIFRPVILLNGQVIGIWKRTLKKGKVIIGIELFRPVSKIYKEKIEEKINSYGNFLQTETEIIFI